jgi:dienelactone hydrolase
MKQLMGMIAVGLLLAACGGQSAETPPGPTAPAATEPPAPTEPAVEPQVEAETEVEAEAAPETEAEPTAESPAEPSIETPTPVAEDALAEALPAEAVTFSTEDGTSIAALYYPPVSGPAPGVLLLHQRGASKEDWGPLVDRLRADRPDLALMAIDFPGHGESGGSYSPEATLAAARAALAEFRGYDAVDGDRVVIVGASIGSDAAVDECGEGCIGAVSVSPGGWLGIPYTEALGALREAGDRPVLCIAAENDSPSPETCREGESAGLSDYRVHLYEGGVHGNGLFFEENLSPEPPIIDLVVTWLGGVLPA